MGLRVGVPKVALNGKRVSHRIRIARKNIVVQGWSNCYYKVSMVGELLRLQVRLRSLVRTEQLLLPRVAQ